MGKCKNREPLPFYVRKAISGYRPYLRDAIARAVQAKQDEVTAKGETLTPADISECVGRIVGELVFGSSERGTAMEELCWDAYKNGHSRPLREVIDELRARVAGSAGA